MNDKKRNLFEALQYVKNNPNKVLRRKSTRSKSKFEYIKTYGLGDNILLSSEDCQEWQPMVLSLDNDWGEVWEPADLVSIKWEKVPGELNCGHKLQCRPPEGEPFDVTKDTQFNLVLLSKCKWMLYLN